MQWEKKQQQHMCCFSSFTCVPHYIPVHVALRGQAFCSQRKQHACCFFFWTHGILTQASEYPSVWSCFNVRCALQSISVRVPCLPHLLQGAPNLIPAGFSCETLSFPNLCRTLSWWNANHLHKVRYKGVAVLKCPLKRPFCNSSIEGVGCYVCTSRLPASFVIWGW